MHFLILTQYYPPEIGAAQARLSAFARELARAGHSVEVVTALPNYPDMRLRPEDRGRLRRTETIDGIPVRRVWLYPASGAGARRLASYLSFSLTGLLGSIGARRPDVVFVESPPLFLGVSGWLAARRFGARLVLNVSDLWPDSVRDLGLMQDGAAFRAALRLERWLYAHAHAVTAVTEGIRDGVIAKGVPARRVLYLPNGAYTDTFRPLPPDPAVRSRYRLPDRPLVTFTGNHGYAQALDTVVLAAEMAPAATVVLVGAGSDKGRVRELAHDRDVANVMFLDPVPPSEIPLLYALSAAGLVTLRGSALMEGARPAKTLAVMACGRPVIYSGRGEGARLVEDAEAGVVVPPDDPAALAAAITGLLDDPAEGSRLGMNGRRYVETHLAWPALAASWLEQLAALNEREEEEEAH